MTTDDTTYMRYCDHPECEDAGDFRAPKSRGSLRDYYWFCLAHVRDYNARWNFCEGMDTDDVEAEIRKTNCWDRPTWPLGTGGKRRYEQADIRDEFDFNADFNANRKHHNKSSTSGSGPRRFHKNSDMEALQIMGLNARASLTDLKARYKELVKRLHPDLNGQNNQAEEHLKTINQAYSTLKKSLA